MRAVVCADSRGSFPCREEALFLPGPTALITVMQRLEEKMNIVLLPQKPDYWFILILNQRLVDPDPSILVNPEDDLLIYPGPLGGG